MNRAPPLLRRPVVLLAAVALVRIVRRYDQTQSWLQFLWLSLRDALNEALKE